MKVEIVKERRKTMVLKVESVDRAVLKVPLRISDRKIEEFLKSKERWLEKTSAQMLRQEEFANSFDFANFIYINGKPEIKVDEMFGKVASDKKMKAIKKYYITLFPNLVDRAKELSVATGLKFKDVKLINSVRVWGSYNINSQMKLNWRLIILPKELIDYVICHELCHSLHMNHKPKFWKDLEKICPNSKKLRKDLERFGFVLKAI